MSRIRLSSTLPKEEQANALISYAESIAENPARFVAIVVFDVVSLTTDFDSGEVTPTVRVRNLELINRVEDRDRITQVAVRAHAERTGETVLPLDLEDEIREAFSQAEAIISDSEEDEEE